MISHDANFSGRISHQMPNLQAGLLTMPESPGKISDAQSLGSISYLHAGNFMMPSIQTKFLIMPVSSSKISHGVKSSGRISHQMLNLSARFLMLPNLQAGFLIMPSLQAGFLMMPSDRISHDTSRQDFSLCQIFRQNFS